MTKILSSIVLPSLITFILIFLVSITCCFQEERSIYLVLLEGEAVAFHGASQNEEDSSNIHLIRLHNITLVKNVITRKLSLY